mmetsp:Transcript_32363/g.63703  ORF Transcript_32363/g.63703 Transcript_32363/m.63703 type:complete len:238 (-) Transcript_32363:183-896(-)
MSEVMITETAAAVRKRLKSADRVSKELHRICQSGIFKKEKIFLNQSAITITNWGILTVRSEKMSMSNIGKDNDGNMKVMFTRRLNRTRKSMVNISEIVNALNSTFQQGPNKKLSHVGFGFGFCSSFCSILPVCPPSSATFAVVSAIRATTTSKPKKIKIVGVMTAMAIASIIKTSTIYGSKPTARPFITNCAIFADKSQHEASSPFQYAGPKCGKPGFAQVAQSQQPAFRSLVMIRL